jgi:TP901 family phage tail tape measure protein
LSKDLELKVKLSTEDLKKGIAQSRAEIMSLDKAKAQIILDLKKDQLLDDFNKIRANLKELNAKPITAQVQVEKEKALNDLAQIKTQLRGIDKVKLDIEVPKNTALELRAIGESFGAISGVLTQLKDDAVASFKEFDAARVKLTTIGESGKALAGELRGLSKELGFQASSAELANGGYTALSGGFTKAGESSKILKAATVGAVGGFSDADKVTKALVATLNAYGGSADDAASFVDKFSSVQQNGIITIDEYAGQIAQLAPIAAQSGVQLDELNGFIATATASGVPASQTFSGLRQAIASTLKPSSEASKLAEKLGISFDAQALKTKGLSGILGDLNAKGADTAENLVQLFGSVEAVSAIAPSAGDGFAKLQANIAGSADSAGLAAKNFDTVANSVGGRAKALQNELNESLSQFGEKILAVTNPVVQGTTAIIRAFNGLPQPVQAAIAVFVGGGAAAAAFGAAISAIAAVASPTLAGLTLLSGGLGTLNTFLTANISLSGLAAAGKAALGTASAAAAGQINLAAIATGTLNLAIAPAIAAIAILAAGLAAINFIRYTKDLEELNAALETNAATAQTSGNETFKLANKLKALGEARKAGNADDKKETGFLNIAKEDIKKLEDLKKQQDEIAAKASDPSQKQTALNIAKDYEIQANALKGQVAELEKIRSAKKLNAEATKTDTKAIKEQLAEQEKLTKAKADIDSKASAKKSDLLRGNEQKSQEKGIETKRDAALDNLKIKQAKEVGEFQDRLENSFNEKKLKGEKAIADFKETREAAIEKQKTDAEADRAKLAEQFQSDRQADADRFRQEQEAADTKYQKQKQENERKFNESLTGAKSLIDREAKIGTADPKEAAKLQQQFAEEDRIKATVASTNVDTNATKEQFAQQAKQIAGVGQISSQEDAAKVQLALAELEAKAKAQFAEQERIKDAEYNAKKQAQEATFQETQRALDVGFKEAQKADALNFETNVLKPQRDALEQEVNAKKLEFEQGTLQPLKLAQETELAAFKQQKEAETNAVKLQFENELEALRTAAKLREIDLDAQAQKTKLDTEAAFKDQQRALDLQNATQVAAILSTAKLEKANLLGAVGIAQPTLQTGIKNTGNNIDKLTSGINSATTKNTNNTTNQNGLNIGNLTVQTPDPMKDMTKVLREIANLQGVG